MEKINPVRSSHAVVEETRVQSASVTSNGVKAQVSTFVSSEKGKNMLTSALIILVGFASFGAGRLSTKNKDAGLTIEYPEPLVSVVANGEVALPAQAGGEPFLSGTVKGASSKPSSNIKTYFASSRGSKYYHLGCSGGKDLKPENKIYFSSAADAEAAGYELSSSCK